MATPPRAYLPDLLYARGKVWPGGALSVKDGTVLEVGEPAVGCEWIRLKGMGLLPGLASAHSHAFQRAIRGRTERRTAGRPDFWAWREAMYRAAARLGPDDLFAVARMAFHEMVRAGITCVGEFHYLHRDPEGRPYGDPNENAKQLARAAREVGIRFALLRVAYARAGHGMPEDPLQRRFVEPSLDDLLRALDDLEAELCGDPLVSLGLAPHSVRACPAPWIERLAAEASRRSLPLHLHVAEQPAEVEACLAEHGIRPVVLLDRLGALSEATTAVHAIHLDEAEIALLGKARATVCACPTTERNLGDGVVSADRLLAAGARLALGTDSNIQVDLLEDARALEYHLRLQRLERAVLDPEGDSRPGEGRPDSLARRLHGFASEGGMSSLGLPGGALAPGDPADFVVVRLDDPSIAGASEVDLLAAVVFSLARTAIRDVYVGGEPAILDGAAAGGRAPAATVAREFQASMRRLWG
jgi:formimidoylglutamate deiminase